MTKTVRSRSESVRALSGNDLQGVGITPSKPTMSLIGTASQNGWNNPEWELLIQQKVDAATDYTRVAYSDIDTFVGTTYYERQDTGSSGVSRAYHPSLLLPTSIPSNSDVTACKDLAIAKLKRKLREDTPRETGMTFLAELGKTRKLVAQVAEATQNILSYMVLVNGGFRRTFNYRRVYTLDPQTARRVIVKKRKTIDTPYGWYSSDALALASNAWLTFSFGIKPLMYDVQNSANALAAYLERDNYRQRYYGNASVRWQSAQSISRLYSVAGAPGVSWYSSTNEKYHSYQCEYNAGIVVPMRSGNVYGLNEAFGLTFGDIIPTIWEITPYSWAIDYFTTAGDFLEDTFVGDSGYPYYVNFSEKYECTSYVNWTPSSTRYNWGDSSGRTQGTYTQFKRTVLNPNTLPHRALRFKTADELGKNAVNKVLNLASVLLSQGKSRAKLRI